MASRIARSEQEVRRLRELFAHPSGVENLHDVAVQDTLDDNRGGNTITNGEGRSAGGARGLGLGVGDGLAARENTDGVAVNDALHNDGDADEVIWAEQSKSQAKLRT
jgi:hypothetical protein